jgi:hypothetical protein
MKSSLNASPSECLSVWVLASRALGGLRASTLGLRSVSPSSRKGPAGRPLNDRSLHRASVRSMDITQLLVNAQSQDATTRKAAEQTLNAAQESAEYGAFWVQCAGELASDAKPLEVRQLAGLILKNALDAKEDARRTLCRVRPHLSVVDCCVGGHSRNRRIWENESCVQNAAWRDGAGRARLGAVRSKPWPADLLVAKEGECGGGRVSDVATSHVSPQRRPHPAVVGSSRAVCPATRVVAESERAMQTTLRFSPCNPSPTGGWALLEMQEGSRPLVRFRHTDIESSESVVWLRKDQRTLTPCLYDLAGEMDQPGGQHEGAGEALCDDGTSVDGEECRPHGCAGASEDRFHRVAA